MNTHIFKLYDYYFPKNINIMKLSEEMRTKMVKKDESWEIVVEE